MDNEICVFDDEDIQKIAETYHSWARVSSPHVSKGSSEYEDVPGFCKSANLDEIRSHDYILTPGRYAGAELADDDDEMFAEKMERLTKELGQQFFESAKLGAEIKENLLQIGVWSN